MCTEVRTIHVDRISYALTVDTYGAEVSASWRYCHCDQPATSTVRDSTVDDAVARVMGDLWDHHESCHASESLAAA
ncbi:MAG TPA: hypothetical protein VGG64_19235 [Pirellulales bacterium]|jgi:hypothetical protein